MHNIRQKTYKKRPLGSLLLKIGSDFAIAVKMYALVQKATASKSVSIDVKSNELLQADYAHVCNDTGEGIPAQKVGFWSC